MQELVRRLVVHVEAFPSGVLLLQKRVEVLKGEPLLLCCRLCRPASNTDSLDVLHHPNRPNRGIHIIDVGNVLFLECRREGRIQGAFNVGHVVCREQAMAWPFDAKLTNQDHHLPETLI